MAQSITAIALEALRGQILTSIYGRRVGLDTSGCLVGVADVRQPVSTITTTAAQNTPGTGISVVSGTLGSTQQGYYGFLPIPIGATKTLRLASTSTAGMLFTPVTSAGTTGAIAILTASDGSSVGQVTLYYPGAGVQLTALNSTLYAVAAVSGSTVNSSVLYTTTT